MKITKAQLKQIIKEELGRNLEESEGAESVISKNRELSMLWEDLNELLAKWETRPGFPGDVAYDAQSDYQRDLEGVMRVFKQEITDRMEDDDPSTEPDRYEREERAIRRAGPKGPMSPEEHAKYMSLYGED